MVTRTVSPDTTPSGSIRSDANELWSAVQPIIVGERLRLVQRAHQLGLSMAHLHVMGLLDAKGALPMSRIAELLGVALPNATGLVSRMQERGVVERRRNESDRRVVLVDLTANGRATLRGFEIARRRRLTNALAQLTAHQRDELMRSIHTLRVAFDQADAVKETRR
jgi:DNA-binding MarR family transcriptional regulator